MANPSRPSSWPTLVIGAFCAGCAALLAWSLLRPAVPDHATSVSPAARPSPTHIVIYLIDTLRADRLGVYGYEKPTSPHIDALANESVVFDNAYAPAPWTLPSVASLMTSSVPCEHGVLVDGHRIADSTDPLASRLSKGGYTAASFHANPIPPPPRFA